MTDIIAFVRPDKPARFSTRSSKPEMLEALPGEIVYLRPEGAPLDSLTLVAGPEGAPAVIDDEAQPLTITASTVGRYHFRAHTADGIDTDIAIVICEPDALARVPERSADGNREVDRRRVLRELARYDLTFNGLASELANRSLANYGA